MPLSSTVTSTLEFSAFSVLSVALLLFVSPAPFSSNCFAMSAASTREVFPTVEPKLLWLILYSVAFFRPDAMPFPFSSVLNFSVCPTGFPDVSSSRTLYSVFGRPVKVSVWAVCPMTTGLSSVTSTVMLVAAPAPAWKVSAAA